ncbi:hypothetical protein GCM10007377_04340 [Galliscardovia ingluviei]|uniref:DUF4234 domain-containing protein n=2 Tax=Galliscardovia ingluviei TaxID=1769422 RepID=A0A8J3EXQ8_9BIFI|nr:hypothetical protein GCM10007377_04340 [Galliscardovia ingluviei]
MGGFDMSTPQQNMPQGQGYGQQQAYQQPNAQYTQTGYAGQQYQQPMGNQQYGNYQQPAYQQPNFQQQYQQTMMPRKQFTTNRSFVVWILLNIITFGIYGLVMMYVITQDVNEICSPRDGRHTYSFLLMVFLFSWLTLGIYPLVWWHMFSNRLGDALQSRGYNRMISASSFWGWNILGALIIVGPFIYLYKMLDAVNTLCADANNRGI